MRNRDRPDLGLSRLYFTLQNSGFGMVLLGKQTETKSARQNSTPQPSPISIAITKPAGRCFRIEIECLGDDAADGGERAVSG